MTKPAASSPTDTDQGVIASAIEIGAADGQVATRIKLLPYGTYSGRDGRGPYKLDGKAHAEQVIATTRTRLAGADMMFDYDHQSALAAVPGVGGTARASGWIKADTLSAEDDGIYASVEWTGPAEEALKKREYRYYSPYFFRRPKTGEVTRIQNVGLTNSPNLELPALASQEAQRSTQGETMTQIALAPLVSALALSASAGETEVLAAIGALKTTAADGEKVLASARTTLGLAADVDGEGVLAAVAAAATGAGAEPDPAKFVPITALTEIRTELATIREEKVLAMVDQAVAGGQITPGQKDWALKLGRKDVGELQSFLGTAPVFEGARTHAEKKVAVTVTSLTEEQVIACEMTGTSREDFLAALNKEIAA